MKPQRNDACPCGSGLKFKKCHGAPGAAPMPAASAAARTRPAELFAAALAHHNAGELAQAHAIYADLLLAHPGNPDVLHNLAGIEVQVGSAERAITHARAAVAAAPGRADLRRSLGAMLIVAQRFDEAVAVLAPMAAAGALDRNGLMNFGAALSRTGRPSRARAVLQTLLAERPDDAAVLALLGNACTDARDWPAAHDAYQRSLELDGDGAATFSNRLLMAQYDDRQTPGTLDALHRQYGARFEGVWSAVEMPFVNTPDPERALRVGFVSADFGEHPVGHLLEPMLRHLRRPGLEVVLYDARPRARDALRDRLFASASATVPVHGLSTNAMLARLRADRVDVLVDLAGHTAGSRLPVFARRAAPVQVTMLGYPSSTGLSCMDLRVTDRWLDPDTDTETEADTGTERCLRVPGGLFRYAPPGAAPAPSPPPLLRLGRPSFGAYGNASKYSDTALAHWAAVLRACPSARLVLKAATLADDETAGRIRQTLAAHGVADERVVFLPWTAHAEHLASYAEVDVVLDTLPFNLVGNTCEALWMGVPVLSLSGDRQAGRLGAAVLHAAGLGEWACDDEAAWVQAACALVTDPAALAARRAAQRGQLTAAGFLDGRGLAEAFHDGVRRAWRAWCGRVGSTPPMPKGHRLLHVGCGHPEAGRLPPGFDTALWQEVRIDLDPTVEPDIVASIDDMSAVPSGSGDALYSSHNLEHVFPRQVPEVLKEFLRVLKPGGFALITLPDLTSAARALLRDTPDEPIYRSPAGPISALDMIYGYEPFVTDGNAFMQHKTGFTAGSLQRAMERAGFERVRVSSHTHALWAVGYRNVG